MDAPRGRRPPHVRAPERNTPDNYQPKEEAWPASSTGRSSREEATPGVMHRNRLVTEARIRAAGTAGNKDSAHKPSDSGAAFRSASRPRSHRSPRSQLTPRGGAVLAVGFSMGEEPNRGSPDLQVSVGHAALESGLTPRRIVDEAQPTSRRDPEGRSTGTRSKSGFADGDVLDDGLDSHPAAKSRVARAPL
jgi:hypothetical protein